MANNIHPPHSFIDASLISPGGFDSETYIVFDDKIWRIENWLNNIKAEKKNIWDKANLSRSGKCAREFIWKMSNCFEEALTYCVPSTENGLILGWKKNTSVTGKCYLLC